MNTITVVQGNHNLLKHKPVIVRIEGEIEDGVLESFRSDFNKAMARNQPIIPIVIHTTGGDVYDALNMMALMKSASVPVATIVPSHAYSAGVLLASAGTKGYRYVGPNATLMMHDTAIEELSGNCRTITHEAAELKRVNTMMYRLMADNCGQPADFFSQKVQSCDGDDLYINAQTAHQWKIADHISLPRLQTNIRVDTSLVSLPAAQLDPNTRFIQTESDDDSDQDSEDDSDEEPPKKRRRKKKKRTRKESVTELLSRILQQDEDE